MKMRYVCFCDCVQTSGRSTCARCVRSYVKYNSNTIGKITRSKASCLKTIIYVFFCEKVKRDHQFLERAVGEQTSGTVCQRAYSWKEGPRGHACSLKPRLKYFCWRMQTEPKQGSDTQLMRNLRSVLLTTGCSWNHRSGISLPKPLPEMVRF